jgi:hypothetical protein
LKALRALTLSAVTVRAIGKKKQKVREREAQKVRRFSVASQREAAQSAKEAAAPKAQSMKGAAKGAAEAAEGAAVIWRPYVEAEAPKASVEAKRKAGSRKRVMAAQEGRMRSVAE